MGATRVSTHTKPMADLALISATTDGFASPRYHDQLPLALASAGVDQASWNAFLSKANHAVRFRWSAAPILGFLFNAHNKNIRPRMRALAEAETSAKTFPNIVVRYEMKTQKVSVAASGGAALALH